jgi:hypothetical protein
MRKPVALAAAIAAVAATTALAGTPPPPNFGGSFDSQSFLGFTAVSHHGRYTKVKRFQWDSLKCQAGGERFTGGLHDPFTVKKDRRFDGKQPVSGVTVPMKATVHGRFNKKGTKATGTLKLTGGCETKQDWTARQNAEK